MGAISFKNVHLVVFLLVSLLAVARAKPLSHWEIHIKNALKEQRLLVHCKSKDNDLGQRMLDSGTEFKWDFKVNIWDTTLFWCYLRKEKKPHEVTFDAFWVEKDTEWLRPRCKDHVCLWTAEDQGIYLYDASRDYDESLHSWKMDPKALLPGPGA